MPPFFVGILCLVLVLLFTNLCHSSFAIIFMGKRERERAVRFTLLVFLISCDSQCSVVLPHGAVSWSAMCNCVIS